VQEDYFKQGTKEAELSSGGVLNSFHLAREEERTSGSGSFFLWGKTSGGWLRKQVKRRRPVVSRFTPSSVRSQSSVAAVASSSVLGKAG